MPKVTILSGRQAQIKVVDTPPITTGFATTSVWGGPDNPVYPTPQVSSPVELGPIIDVIPYVFADGYTITLRVIPTVKEFIGYGSASDAGVTWTVSNPNGDALISANPLQFIPVARYPGVGVERPVTTPLPIFRLRQVATSAVILDGQTLVLANSLPPDPTNEIQMLSDLPIAGRLFRSEVQRTKRKLLLIFLTATIVDSAGNRVHSPELLLRKQDAPP
jgi:type II secretory pathway component GspD/PulD (secretin)